MSMVKADMLYQLDFHLKEIKLNQNEDFGGVGLILFGDLLQLKPVLSRYIFEEPANHKWHAAHNLEPLWRNFKPMFLRTNHRQEDDPKFAELLRRTSRKLKDENLTKEDKELLQSRVRPLNHPEIPKDAMYVMCKNQEVDKINEEKLEIMPGENIEIK